MYDVNNSPYMLYVEVRKFHFLNYFSQAPTSANVFIKREINIIECKKNCLVCSPGFAIQH